MLRPGAAPRGVTGSRSRVAAGGRPAVYHGLVRRLFAWTAGVVGIAALARLLARARRPEPEPWTPAGDERAEALRRKLSETRATVEAPAPGYDATLASATAEAHGAEREDAPAPGRPSESIEERRARVHAKAQEAIDAMQEALE